MSLTNVVSVSNLNSTLTSINKISDVSGTATKISNAAKSNKVANETKLATSVETTSTGIEKCTTEADYLEEGKTVNGEGVCRMNDIKGMESAFQKTCQKTTEINHICEKWRQLDKFKSVGKLKEVVSSCSPKAIKNAIKSSTGEEPPATVLADTTTPENAALVEFSIEEEKTASQSISETIDYFNKGLKTVMKATNGGELVKAALTSNNVLSGEINQIAKGVLKAQEIANIQEHLLNKDKDLALLYAISLLDEKGLFKDARAVYNTGTIQEAIKLINPKFSSKSLGIIGSLFSSILVDPEHLSIIRSLLSKNKILAKSYLTGVIKNYPAFKNDNNLSAFIDVFVDYGITQFETIIDNENKTIDREQFEKDIYTIDPSLNNVVDNRLTTSVDFGETTSPAYDMSIVSNNWDNPTSGGDVNKSFKFEYISSFEELVNEFRACTREITETVIHWTESFIDQGDLGSEEIHQWHEPIGGIGYHFVIKRNGDIQRGRPLNKEGDHAEANGHNKYSIGVCLVAGYNCPSGTINKEDYLVAESITGEQYNTLATLLKAFYTVWPGGQVWGHNDTDPNNATDPGFDVPEFIFKKFGKINASGYGSNPPLSAAELGNTNINI